MLTGRSAIVKYVPFAILELAASKYDGQVPEKVDGVDVEVPLTHVAVAFAIGAACLILGAFTLSTNATASKIVRGFEVLDLPLDLAP